MPITVIVRTGAGEEARLTFDGMQRVVLGRGASCDVRLPDSSVSHRHASLRAQGAEFAVVDEGSTNGTFVGGVRVAPHTSRIVRSGDAVRLGRVEIELRVDQSPVTRDVAAATRDLALALVSRAMEAMGEHLAPRVRVVEGRDQGATLALVQEGREYLVGRGPHCDLPLADADASREHAVIVRRTDVVSLRDLGAKNATWIGEAAAPRGGEVAWRPAQMVRIGRTVLALEEPVMDALARIEGAPDEAIEKAPERDAATSNVPAAANATMESAVVAPVAEPPRATAPPRERAGWSMTDVMVMLAAIGVLALSLAGLVWLLKG